MRPARFHFFCYNRGQSLTAGINWLRLGCLIVLYHLHHLLSVQLCSCWYILEAVVISLDKGQFSNPGGTGALKPQGERVNFLFWGLFFIIGNSYFLSCVKLPTSQTSHQVCLGLYELLMLSLSSFSGFWKATEIRHLYRTVPSVERSILVSQVESVAELLEEKPHPKQPKGHFLQSTLKGIHLHKHISKPG